VPQNTFGTLPVWSMPGALALLGALTVLGRRKLR